MYILYNLFVGALVLLFFFYLVSLESAQDEKIQRWTRPDKPMHNLADPLYSPHLHEGKRNYFAASKPSTVSFEFRDREEWHKWLANHQPPRNVC